MDCNSVSIQSEALHLTEVRHDDSDLIGQREQADLFRADAAFVDFLDCTLAKRKNRTDTRTIRVAKDGVARIARVLIGLIDYVISQT